MKKKWLDYQREYFLLYKDFRSIVLCVELCVIGRATKVFSSPLRCRLLDFLKMLYCIFHCVELVLQYILTSIFVVSRNMRCFTNFLTFYTGHEVYAMHRWYLTFESVSRRICFSKQHQQKKNRTLIANKFIHCDTIDMLSAFNVYIERCIVLASISP